MGRSCKCCDGRGKRAYACNAHGEAPEDFHYSEGEECHVKWETCARCEGRGTDGASSEEEDEAPSEDLPSCGEDCPSEEEEEEEEQEEEEAVVEQELLRPRLDVEFLRKYVQPDITAMEKGWRPSEKPSVLCGELEFEVQDPNPTLQGYKARLSKELGQRRSLASIGYLEACHEDSSAASSSVCVELRDLRGSYVGPPELFSSEERLCDARVQGFFASGFRTFVHERMGVPASWGRTDAELRAKILAAELEGEQAELAAEAMEHRRSHRARWILPDATALEPSGDTRSLAAVFDGLAREGHAQTLQQGAKQQKFSVQLVVQPR